MNNVPIHFSPASAARLLGIAEATLTARLAKSKIDPAAFLQAGSEIRPVYNLDEIRRAMVEGTSKFDPTHSAQ